MTISEQYRKAVLALDAVSAESEAEARELMAHVYGLPPGRLIMRFFDTAEHVERVDALVRERLSGRPLAYVLGERNFYGLDFFVDERVLIPRSDTESVAEAAIHAAGDAGICTAADLCCGSGCIGITLLTETDLEQVVFCDISADALEIARQNAARHGVLDRARFTRGDFLQALEGPVDLIVCNPPYVSENEYPDLETQVRDYEPRGALVAPEGGMFFYRLLARDAPGRLSEGGVLIAETGDTQAEQAAEMFAAGGFTDVRIGYDLSGKQRFVQGRSAQHAG